MAHPIRFYSLNYPLYMISHGGNENFAGCEEDAPIAFPPVPFFLVMVALTAYLD